MLCFFTAAVRVSGMAIIPIELHAWLQPRLLESPQPDSVERLPPKYMQPK
jgi:hypothetical protein